MKNVILICMVVAGVAFFVTPVCAAETCYVQSMKAKVMSAPSFKADVVAEVAKGQQLTSLEHKGRWVKVKYKTKIGYIFSYLVGTREPIEKVGLIKGNEGDIKHGVRRRASTYTSAAAARGLASDDRRRLSTEEKASYDGLAEIESITISSDELSKFIAETR
jgi:hypothetical protein